MRFSALLASTRLASTQPPTSATRSGADCTSPTSSHVTALTFYEPSTAPFAPADSVALGSAAAAGKPEPLNKAAVRASTSREPSSARSGVYNVDSGGGEGTRAAGWFSAMGAGASGEGEGEQMYRTIHGFAQEPGDGQRYVYHPLGVQDQICAGHPVEHDAVVGDGELNGHEVDVGGEYAFTFDSPVLQARHGPEDAYVVLASPHSIASGASTALYSSVSIDGAPLSPISPISPIVGVEYQEQYSGSSTSQAQHAAYLSTSHSQPYPLQSLAFAPGSTPAAPSFAQYDALQPYLATQYQTSTSAPSYTHGTFGTVGPSSYPPTFSSAISTGAYQSFTYSHPQAEEYGSATDSAYGYFAPPPSVPPPSRRVSTGSIFASFPPPSFTSSMYARAAFPPLSRESFLAAGVPAYLEHEHTQFVKLEAESPDLPPALPHSHVETLFGSPMSSSSFGAGAGSVFGGGAPSTPTVTPPTKKYPSSGGRKQEQHKRRSSIALDPDYDPSPSTAPEMGAKSRPISPITGKPVKVISKRGWPPKDAHKRVYLCEIEGCGKTFGRPSARDTHMRSHNGDKPFECPIPSCLRRFSVFSNLKRHMVVHPTVDFRKVTVHDLAHIHFVPDPPGAEPTSEGGRLEWLDSEEADGEGEGVDP
ncbi:hypothetical protein JCM3770_007472 [Rhodotorula araucariae]